MFRNTSRGQKQLKSNNFFISQLSFKCNMSVASVLPHRSNSML